MEGRGIARSAVRLAASVALAFGPPAVVLAMGWTPGWWTIPVWFAQVVGMTGLSNAAHEAVHGHLLGRRRMDRAVGRGLHGLLLLNHDVHRWYHLTHHAHTGDPDDPEGVFGFDQVRTPGRYVAYLVRWSIPPCPLHANNWRWGVLALVGRFPRPGGPTRRRAAWGWLVPLATAAATAAVTVADPVVGVTLVLVPLLCLFPLFAYVTALPEHFGLVGDDAGPSTRNITTWPWLQYLLWNFNLHAVHHLDPSIPHAELPRRLDDAPDAPTVRGYLRFHREVIGEVRARRAATGSAR